MALWQWSRTANANSSADPSISIPEGMPPSSVDDSLRATMARVAEWRDDTCGILLADTGSTGSAYVVTTFEGIQTPTPANGTRVSFYPANTNLSGVTLAVDGGTAFPINVPAGVAIGVGVMVAFTPYDVVFTTAGNQWVLKGVFNQPASPSLIPLGGLIDYVGGSAPNGNFALPFGQAISRTTYSTLFALTGTTFGAGDGVTTFNVIDMRGFIGAGLDNMGGSAAGRVTGLTTLGINGGEQNHTLSLGEIPSHNHGVTDPGHSHNLNYGGTTNVSAVTIAQASGASIGGSGNPQAFNNSLSIVSNTTGITIQNAGSGSAHNNLQPTMGVNKLLRIL